MKSLGIAKQLLLLVALFAVVTVAAVGGLSYLLRSSSASSQQILQEARTLSEESFGLVDKVFEFQSNTQKVARTRDIDELEELIASSESLVASSVQAIDDSGASGSGVSTAFEGLREANTKVLEAVLVGQFAVAQQAVMEQSNPAFQTLLEELRKFRLEVSNRLDADVAAAAAGSARLQAAIFVAVGIAVVLLFVAGFLLRRSIVAELSTISGTLQEASRTVNIGAEEIESAGQIIASGSSEQAASLEEISASLTEMSGTIRSSADTAHRAEELSAATREAADRGTTTMAEMGEAMKEIKQSSDDVAKIIKSIDEIAFQTNILALNAAVEAARAGEAGKGFAVVADEVRSLAQRAADAATETGSLIDSSLARSDRGLTMSSSVIEVLQDVALKAREMDTVVVEIASAYNEHSKGIEQVSGAINQVEKVTQHAAAQSEETASTAANLSAQAAELERCVASLTTVIKGAGHSH